MTIEKNETTFNAKSSRQFFSKIKKTEIGISNKFKDNVKSKGMNSLILLILLEIRTQGCRRRRLEGADESTEPEDTHLLHKGKYHFTADLLLDWLGFSCFAYVELDRDLQVWSDPSRRSGVYSGPVYLNGI